MRTIGLSSLVDLPASSPDATPGSGRAGDPEGHLRARATFDFWQNAAHGLSGTGCLMMKVELRLAPLSEPAAAEGAPA